MYDLTDFQRDLLYVIAGLNDSHGLAIVDAELLDAKSLRNHIDEGSGLLVAEPLDVKVDGRAEPHGRALRPKHQGGDRTGTDAVIPPADLEDGLGIDPESITGADGESPAVALYTGRYEIDGVSRGVIALGQPRTVTISTALLED